MYEGETKCFKDIHVVRNIRKDGVLVETGDCQGGPPELPKNEKKTKRVGELKRISVLQMMK